MMLGYIARSDSLAFGTIFEVTTLRWWMNLSCAKGRMFDGQQTSLAHSQLEPDNGCNAVRVVRRHTSSARRAMALMLAGSPERTTCTMAADGMDSFGTSAIS